MPNGESGGFLERLRNSPRTVSTIIVILIVLGAVFAFSDRGDQPSPSPAPSASATEQADTQEPAGEATPTPVVKGETGAEDGAAMMPTPAPRSEAQETESAYIEVAARGEGITHLARRAMLRYVEANAPGYELTAEHKVWIEDALKDQLKKPLGVGENLTVEKKLIQDAVERAKSLTDAQRKHLQRFSRLVSAYRTQ